MLVAFVAFLAALEPLRRARVDERLWALPVVAGLALASDPLVQLLHLPSPAARIAAGMALSVLGNVRFVRDAEPVVLSPVVILTGIGYGLGVGQVVAAIAGALAAVLVTCLNRRDDATAFSRAAAVFVVVAGVLLALVGAHDALLNVG